MRLDFPGRSGASLSYVHLADESCNKLWSPYFIRSTLLRLKNLLSPSGWGLYKISGNSSWIWKILSTFVRSYYYSHKDYVKELV